MAPVAFTTKTTARKQKTIQTHLHCTNHSDFFTCVWITTIACRGLKGQCHRSMLRRVLARMATWSVWPGSVIEGSMLSNFLIHVRHMLSHVSTTTATITTHKRQWMAVASPGPYTNRHIAPAPHHSVFYRPDALPATQPTVSKHWRNYCYY